MLIINYSFATLVCIGEINITVDIAGNATLYPNDVLISPLNPDHVYLLSPNTFNCSDIGHPITVLVEEQSLAGTLINSCWLTLHVESKLSPDPCIPPTAYCLSSINVSLDAEGVAVITPEMLVPDPLNPLYTYSCVPSVFDCSDIGPNTVTLYVTGPGGTNYCIMTVNIEDKRKDPPACLIIDLEEFEYLPAHVFDVSVLPDQIIKFEASFSLDPLILKNVKPEFELFISKDGSKGPGDELLFSQPIYLKKKSEMSGEFRIPLDIKPGAYYIIGEVTIHKKQYNIGFNPIVQPIKVGTNSPQYKLNSNKVLARDVNQNIFVYPNPFRNDLILNINNHNTGLKKITLFELTGKRILDLSPNEIQFNLPFLIPGIYLLETIDLDGMRSIHKIIKQ
jgi:hypothetical protein